MFDLLYLFIAAIAIIWLISAFFLLRFAEKEGETINKTWIFIAFWLGPIAWLIILYFFIKSYFEKEESYFE